MSSLPTAAPRTLSGYRVQDTSIYPDGDGEPMSETPWHGRSMDTFRDLLCALRVLRGKEKEWYVVRDNFWYYQQGNGNKRYAPDVMFIPDVEAADQDRRSWLEWLEGDRRPTVVYEALSESTWQYNLAGKKDAYEALGVAEYFAFDPRAEYVRPNFRAFRLVEGVYEAIVPDEFGRYDSEELDAKVWPDGTRLRMIDRRTGEEVLTRMQGLEESVTGLEESVADLEEIADDLAEALDEQRASTRTANERAEAETRRAQAEALRAQAETRRAEGAESRLAEVQANREKLHAALRAMGIDPDELP